jgi:predicted dehydrogenase
MAVKIGIISFAHMHAHSYAECLKALPEVEFVGVADDVAKRADEVAWQFGVRALAEDELLARAQGVIVTTENALHRAKVLKAAAAGVHVMCEKPLGPNLDDCRAMIAGCKAAGVQLMQAFPCRYSPVVKAGLELARSGELGQIIALKGTNRGRNPGGWFVEPEFSGGGAVMDHTVHIADLIRAITGDEFATVYCEKDTVYNPGLRCDDTGLLTMTLKGGAFATLDCSWSRPPHFPVWGDATLYVVGTKGNADMNLFIERLDHYRNRDSAFVWEPYSETPDLAMVADFARVAATGEPAPITGEDGMRAVEVVIAAYESAKTGEVVSLG